MRETSGMSPHIPSSGEFRADLQILRALAVIIVLLFHLDINLFKGGFVGVDVFFVLSGYFVTHTLIGRSASVGRNEILGFYNRRLRRILPLASVVLLAAMVSAPFLLAPPEIKDLIQQVKAAALGVPNMFYSEDNNYFIETLFRPLLHYWSLGVEYQYYLLFPLIFLAAAKYKKAGPLIFAASFVLCVAMTASSTEKAFFYVITRIWEFMLGFYAFKFGKAEFLKTRPYTIAVPLLSIAAIVTCAMLYTPKMFFPGLTAAVPAIATALLIYYGLPDMRGVLAYPQKALVWIGTLSFSIYLWHYPVIWLFTYNPFVYYPNPDAVQSLWIVGITMILSVISYRFIEEPMRSVRVISNKKFYAIMAGIYIALAGLGMLYTQKNYYLRDFNEAQKAVLFAVNDRLPYRCDKESMRESKAFESCRLGDPGKEGRKVVLLVGDSHSDAIKPAFMRILPDYGHSLFIMKENYNPGQDGYNAPYFIKEMEARHVTDFVLHGYIKDKETLTEMDKVIEAAKKTGARVHIIDPTPIFDTSVAMDVYKGEPSKITRALYREQYKDYFVWKKQVQAKSPQVWFYEIEDTLCPDLCLHEKDGKVLYFDAHHLTITGSMLLLPAVKAIYGR